ncbi:Pentatricopeptide repeat-containing protein [Drosera capensis]
MRGRARVNAFALSVAVKAAIGVSDEGITGRCFHGVLLGNGFGENVVIDMYGKNGDLGDARNVFDEMSERDAVCWSSMVSALVRNDRFEEGFGMFWAMQRRDRERLVRDGYTYGSLLTACGNLGRLRQGGEVHAREMEPRDLYSFGTVLRACAGLAAVEQGKEVHCQYLRKGGWKHAIAESALVDLYAKSGHVNYARRIFDQMAAKNLISWNSMICGLAQNGHGLVDHGREYFHSMNGKYGVKPGIEHFNCMVDLLGRAGLVEGRFDTES